MSKTTALLAVIALLLFTSLHHAATFPPANIGVGPFTSVICPKEIITANPLEVKAVYYTTAGDLECAGVPLMLSVTDPYGNPQQYSRNCVFNQYVFSVDTTKEGSYTIYSYVPPLPNPSVYSANCRFTVSREEPTPVPELSEWSLLVVLLSVFALLGGSGWKKKHGRTQA